MKEMDQLTQNELEKLALFSRGIAHDYNNILTVIIGNITFIRSFPDLDDEVEEILDSMKIATDQGRIMTQNIQRFARLSTPDLQNGVVEEVISTAFRTVFPEGGVPFERTETEETKGLKFDAFQLTQAFTFLFRYCNYLSKESSAFSLKIQKTLIESKNYINFTLTDKEALANESEQAAIFTPLFSMKKPDNGMGILSVQRIIQMHDGLFSASFREDKGVIFKLNLPLSE